MATDFTFDQPFSCHIETIGSHWFFNGKTHMYIRIPKEGHRDNPAWGDENAGALRDNFWLPYSSMSINIYDWHPCCSVKCCPHLRIITPSGPLFAPKARLIETVTREGIKV